MSRRPQRQTLQSVHIPAPVAGINAVAPMSAMGEADCSYGFNVIPGNRGLDVRPGYQEWVTGITGAIDNTIRSTLSFTGSAKNGSADRVFAATSSGIWDVTTSTDAPTIAIAFPDTSGDAGHGVSCVCATPAGRFLLYTDEVNGLYIYPESTQTWAKVDAGTTVAWEGATGYVVGDTVYNGLNVYECTTAGTSAASGGPTGTATDTTDGTAHWRWVEAKESSVIGPALADQRAGFTADPGNFVFVAVWKSRVWFVERDTSRAYYLDVNSIYGTANAFDFGSKMRAGGPLVGLWNWSYDGGNGLDTLLVGISGAGDVVIYQGTDPTSASTFGLKGAWYVGGVPAGRRIATDTGGDLLVICRLGAIQLSRLVVGAAKDDPTQYATAKIGPLFVRLATVYGANRGWAVVVHPTANALVVIVPTAEGETTIQLVMSYGTKGWFVWRDLPVQSAAAWSGELYFGTADGKVCRNISGPDAVALADPETYTPVDYSFLGSFQTMGAANLKQVHLLQAEVLSDTPNAVPQVAARYDYSILEPAAATAASTGGGDAWDVATWDAAVWGGEYSVTQKISGATGMGRAVAVAVRGLAVTPTTIVGVNVSFTVGGLL